MIDMHKDSVYTLWKEGIKIIIMSNMILVFQSESGHMLYLFISQSSPIRIASSPLP